MAELPNRLAAALADRYLLERELGAGAMATVYLATDLKHSRRVAIKVLNPELAVALGADRFLREIETTASLRHPHILPLYDSGEADGFLFYVMPLVEGEALRDRLTRDRQLPVNEALRLTREIADALGYAHAHGVIHRDIKPENILLESGHAVVADFGIAKAVGAAGRGTLTQTGMSIGTPAYMSPEQAAGEDRLDARSDLYSLGCVLYELLAGQPPFTGPTSESIARQHVIAPPPDVTHLRSTVAAAVSDALQRALAKNPADRFDSMERFAEALREGASTPPVPTQAAPSVAHHRRGRSRVRKTIGAAVGVVLILAAIAVMWYQNKAGPAVGAASVAVLPFADLSPDRSNAYLGDGIAETLINALANVAGLRVAARTSAFLFRDRSTDVREIGRQLGVASVLEGSVQRSGDRLRVMAQLIQAADGLSMWSRTFDRSASDIFDVQDEVRGAVVTVLQGKLVAHSDTASPIAGTGNPAAYDAYLLGRFYWNKRTATDLVRAAAYFRDAIRADSNYAQAWTGLADSYVLFGPGEYNVPRINEDSILTLAEHAARRAIALAPQLGEAWTSLGAVQEKRLRWDEAGDAFAKGIALAPQYATAHQWYADHLIMLNRWDEAIRAFERARELDPLSIVILFSLAGAYDGGDRLADAEPVYDQALALFPEHPSTLFYLFGHELVAGRSEKAASVYRRYQIATGVDSSTAAYIERRLRDASTRDAVVEEISRTERRPLLGLILQRTLKGDDAAIAFLDELERGPRRAAFNKQALHVLLGPRLRAEPRVHAILARLGFPPPAGTKDGR